MKQSGEEPREARFYIREAGGRVRCGLCAHACLIEPGKTGVCQVRENQNGTLVTWVYGKVIAQQADPIEKKPLFHFWPGSVSYSIASPGCNFRCAWCQNAEISQPPYHPDLLHTRFTPPRAIVEAALEARCRSISFTYTEPTLNAEYALEVSRLARPQGLATVFVTNGYMTPAMLEDFRPDLDAANVDLKAFREETYRRYMGARLQPVLDSLKKMCELKIWVEVTTLVIPGVNDDPGELRELAQFIALELGPDTPWHVSGFFPTYHFVDAPATPVATLQRAHDIGREAGLNFVYVGNRGLGEDTLCPRCHERIIRRRGFSVLENRIQPPGQCPTCRMTIPGIGMTPE